MKSYSNTAMKSRSHSSKTQRYSPYDSQPHSLPESLYSFSAPTMQQQQFDPSQYAASAAANPQAAMFAQLAAQYAMFAQQGQQGQQQGQQEVIEGAPPDMLKIAQTSNPKSVAGKIAADARAGAVCPLVARGKTAVNIATKAIAMACSFLVQNGVTLTVSPYHLNDGDNSSGRSVVFYLKKASIVSHPPPKTTLKLKKNSAPASVGGSLATKVRQGEVVAMEGIGPDAVSAGVDAFVVARRFLKADSKLDVQFTPAFVSVQFGDKTASAIHFQVSAVPRT